MKSELDSDKSKLLTTRIYPADLPNGVYKLINLEEKDSYYPYREQLEGKFFKKKGFGFTLMDPEDHMFVVAAYFAFANFEKI